MLELATLGLLQKEPLHGYRLKQQMELFMSGCISVNYGAIYPLLKRLEDKHLIQVFTEEENNNPRKIYSITSEGKEKWYEKMLEHPHESWINSRSRFMIKYFFFSYLEVQERLKLLEHRFMTCKLYLEKKELDFEFVCSDPYQLEAWERYKWAIIDEINWLKIQKVNLTKTLSVIGNF
ncbi:MAG: PadR family transcriptional regulator [Cyanobacteria bacterium]|nr:PadR family transcriptional regulator [Cyanobacteria bacterium CG_2015-16_32_12]NCO78398.1 PadR family transcriptional regulator [Cyanobacteria bacterium CG_2015-22_32_23]NCQ02967.1 PadR family transcriptional regulator [Cyanobacteria bacterium CG_2015-09_32_10]NCQ41623.1 PadR family transcriptional regulator [Cyanobacteria bacterium CG_2015-04_32_10]NCS85041.1 PadR family transcriptional regulator [Cyanobacteria bacterium CG_2015-02_32_10]